jgi:hypothetical protein
VFLLSFEIDAGVNVRLKSKVEIGRFESRHRASKQVRLPTRLIARTPEKDDEQEKELSSSSSSRNTALVQCDTSRQRKAR